VNKNGNQDESVSSYNDKQVSIVDLYI